MKTSLILLTMLLVISVRAYPPAPASQAAVNAGLGELNASALHKLLFGMAGLEI